MKQSFTLIEMVIVVVIIGILAAALIPRINSQQVKVRDMQRQVDMKNLYTALQLYYHDKDDYPVSACNVASCRGPDEYSNGSRGFFEVAYSKLSFYSNSGS